MHILTSLFNLTLSTGDEVPQKWKSSRDTPPLFQRGGGGSRTEINNYRPVSVLPVVMKIFERLVHNQLYSYLCIYELMIVMSPNQSNLKPQPSTQTTQVEVHDHMLKLMLVDLSGAFYRSKMPSTQFSVRFCSTNFVFRVTDLKLD